MKMFAPNMIQATTTSTSSGSGSSAYSSPWFQPISRQTTAPSTITFHSAAVATPSFSLHSFTPHSRGTRKNVSPMSAASSQPNSMPLTCSGRSRP